MVVDAVGMAESSHTYGRLKMTEEMTRTGGPGKRECCPRSYRGKSCRKRIGSLCCCSLKNVLEIAVTRTYFFSGSSSSRAVRMGASWIEEWTASED